MPRPRVLALVLAGGAGGRLELLTQHRAKPAVPYAGTHRLVDVPLTMCGAAAVDDVWLVQQNTPTSLSDHVASGRPWDLDRTEGGLLLLSPSQGASRSGFATGTADSLWRQAPLVRQTAPDVLLVMSADAAYRLDLAEVVDAHLQSGAAVTAVTTTTPAGEDTGRFGVVEVDGERVTGYAYKPDAPASDVVTTEVFAMSPQEVLDLLDQLEQETGGEDEDDSGLGDLGDALLPRLVEAGRVRAHPLPGYWRDVGTIGSYWRGHQELLGPDPAFSVDDPRLPLRTRPVRRDAARLLRGAQVVDSLLGPGCSVAGTVERSVLSAGVVVEEGAVVRDCVLLPGAVVRRGAVVERAVLDDRVEVTAGARVGGPGRGDGQDDESLTLVGQAARVAGEVAPGARVDPGDGGEDGPGDR